VSTRWLTSLYEKSVCAIRLYISRARYGTPSAIAEFDYEYDPNTSNIAEIEYKHRGDSNEVDFSYDDLDRLTLAEYNIADDSNEVFTIDDLGNRDLVNVRDGNNVDYVIDANTNRYDSVGGNSLTYDAAGNLTTDKDGYRYEYDYENRIVLIKDVNNADVAEFAYDALGRRIRKIDPIADETTLYYYNDKWQVLCDYNDSDVRLRKFLYGNYIDEALAIVLPDNIYFYSHDHLHSPAALMTATATVLERYEYDAYGNATILSSDFEIRDSSLYDNPYLFTGRRVDILDNGSLKLQYNRNRYYDQYTGRWLTHDPLGITPNPQRPNMFAPSAQPRESISLYEYARSEPVREIDPYALKISKFKCCTQAQQAVIQAADAAVTKRIPVVEADLAKFDWQWLQLNYILPERRRMPPYSPLIYGAHNRGMRMVFLRMNKRLTKGIGAKCECASNKYCKAADAYVRAYFARYIHFCPGFFKDSPTGQSEIFLHELSHLAATTKDIGLRWSSARPRRFHEARKDAFYVQKFQNSDTMKVEKLWIWMDLFPKY